MSNPICTVMVGLPGLGKSTVVRKMTKSDPDVFVYSTDDLIEEWAADDGKTYDEVFEDCIKDATKEMDYLLTCAIRDGEDIIWDQTNTGMKKRKKIIDKMKQAGYNVECVCICPPEKTHIDDLKSWVWRLKTRPGKTIPDHVMKSMADNYVEPNTSEGFRKITFYDMWGKIVGVEFNGIDKAS